MSFVVFLQVFMTLGHVVLLLTAAQAAHSRDNKASKV